MNENLGMREKLLEGLIDSLMMMPDKDGADEGKAKVQVMAIEGEPDLASDSQSSSDSMEKAKDLMKQKLMGC